MWRRKYLSAIAREDEVPIYRPDDGCGSHMPDECADSLGRLHANGGKGVGGYNNIIYPSYGGAGVRLHDTDWLAHGEAAKAPTPGNPPRSKQVGAPAGFIGVRRQLPAYSSSFSSPDGA
ncbi:hypothetical protein E2562_009534 [Oryza meyeriana var. granulata]|uniref:Uncharacterized protein n=1 Tax=Oryza meyeriana var. granulata TaxID=110450 RepID=A0A6G1F5S4_9ORYZ|nr:hypothetical protein E2562_009534 [Oryza meyeriana var. granulata]